MLAAPVGDDEENTPMLVRDSESNTPMLVRDSESTTASGTNQTAQPPRRKIGRCPVRYAAVLPVLFIYMWALLGEEEVRSEEAKRGTESAFHGHASMHVPHEQ